MECILEAHPVPDIKWFHGDISIVDSSRIKMSRKATSKDTYILTLEITNPTLEDGGNYRCNAFNSYGESNANIALNFQGTFMYLIRITCIRSIRLFFRINLINMQYTCMHTLYNYECISSINSIERYFT